MEIDIPEAESIAQCPEQHHHGATTFVTIPPMSRVIKESSKVQIRRQKLTKAYKQAVGGKPLHDGSTLARY